MANKEITRITRIILICLILAILLMVGLYPVKKHANKSYQEDITKNLNDSKQMNTVIAEYLENKVANWHSDPSEGGKFFCAADIHWSQPVDPDETVVFAANNCDEVIMQDGDLRGASGFGHNSHLFKLKKNQGKWIVVDEDSREFSKQTTTQAWVLAAEKLIPDQARNNCIGKCFSTEGTIDKAAVYYHIEVPRYPLNICHSTKDCPADSVCVHPYSYNKGEPNTCVKKCQSNKNCGVAHTCREQWINGENTKTTLPICIPDLLHYSLEKDPSKLQ